MHLEPGNAVTIEEVPLGSHRIDLIGPDLVIARWIGDVGVQDILDLVRLVKARPHGGSGVFVIFDLRRGGHIGPEARKVSSSDTIFQSVREVVTFGASFHIRVIVTMLMKAVQLRRGGERTKRMTFVDTEAEALALVDEARRNNPRGLGI